MQTMHQRRNDTPNAVQLLFARKFKPEITWLWGVYARTVSESYRITHIHTDYRQTEATETIRPTTPLIEWYGTRSQGISQFYLHAPRSSANGMNHTCLCLPSRSWYYFYRPRRDARLSWPWVAGWLHTAVSVRHHELQWTREHGRPSQC